MGILCSRSQLESRIDPISDLKFASIIVKESGLDLIQFPSVVNSMIAQSTSAIPYESIGEDRLYFYSKAVLNIYCDFDEFHVKIKSLIKIASFLDYRGYRHVFEMNTSTNQICSFYNQSDIYLSENSLASPIMAIAIDDVKRINLINCPYSIYKKFERKLKTSYKMGINNFEQVEEHSYQFLLGGSPFEQFHQDRTDFEKFLLSFFVQLYKNGWQIFGRFDENSIMFIYDAKSVIQTTSINPEFLMELSADSFTLRLVNFNSKVVTRLTQYLSAILSIPFNSILKYGAWYINPDDHQLKDRKFMAIFLIRLFENLRRVGFLPLSTLPAYSNVFLITSIEKIQISLWCLWIEVKPYKIWLSYTTPPIIGLVESALKLYLRTKIRPDTSDANHYCINLLSKRQNGEIELYSWICVLLKKLYDQGHKLYFALHPMEDKPDVNFLLFHKENVLENGVI